MRFVVGQAFGILPTEKRLRSLSQFQLMWLYANVKRKQAIAADTEQDRLRLICTFINPKVAQDVFKETKETVSENFEADLRNMDPGIDLEKYKQMME